MARRGTTIIGLAKLDKKLKNLPKQASSTIKLAMEKSADEIVSMMQSLVPKDSGELRDSIGWTWGKAPKGSTALAIAKSSLGGDLTITIYAGNEEAYYAKWVEFGTAAGIKGQRSTADTSRKTGRIVQRTHSGTSAQPFFFVSWRANRKSTKARIRRAVNKAAKIEAAK